MRSQRSCLLCCSGPDTPVVVKLVKLPVAVRFLLFAFCSWLPGFDFAEAVGAEGRLGESGGDAL